MIQSECVRLIEIKSTSSLLALHEAIQEAVDLIAPQYIVAEEDTKSERLGKGKKTKKRTDKSARKRNAKASNAQPAKLKGKTSQDKSIDEYDVTKMTDKQYAKLPSDIKSKLRGD